MKGLGYMYGLAFSTAVTEFLSFHSPSTLFHSTVSLAARHFRQNCIDLLKSQKPNVGRSTIPPTFLAAQNVDDSGSRCGTLMMPV